MTETALHHETHRASGAADQLEAVRGYLGADERLLWSGRPDPSAEAVGPYLGCVGLGLAALSVAIALALLASILDGETPGTTRGALAMMLVVPAGTLAGGVLLLGEPGRRRRRATRSLHVVTDRRLLTLVQGRRSDALVFIAARAIGPVHLTPLAGDRGTITIETHSSRAAGSTTRLTQTFAWFGVPDARTAYGLIAQLQDPEG